ncbi:ESPR domain-containing protein, partial [Neisseria sp.]
MNKVFKVIWNHATQTWTAVSEISHAHGKKSASDKRKAVAA